jgi:hypothetical protein
MVNSAQVDPNEMIIPKPLCVLREDLVDTVFYGLKQVLIDNNRKSVAGSSVTINLVASVL